MKTSRRDLAVQNKAPVVEAVTQVQSAHVWGDGDRVTIEFAARSGDLTVVEVSLEIASQLSQRIIETIERTAYTHALRRNASPETDVVQAVSAKSIVSIGTGLDYRRRVVVLTGRHSDTTETYFPIAEAHLRGLIGKLQELLGRFRSGEKPLRH